KPFDREAVQRLAAHDWPGNIRELRNAVERLLILAPGPVATVADVERLAGMTTGEGGRGTGTADLAGAPWARAATFEQFKQAAEAVRPSGAGWLATWAKVALGVLIAVGVTPGVWPYSHGCGLRLIFYLVGVATVIATGLWASIASWRRRMGVAHVVSQILIVWGVLLMTREVLPRVGDAKVASLWLCPDVQPH